MKLTLWKSQILFREIISPKVQMFIAWQMCSIHIREITTELLPSFNHRKRKNINARKADWSEKNWSLTLATRNQLLRDHVSSKTMPERTEMPSRKLFKERWIFFTRLQVVKYILWSSISEHLDMMRVSFETNMIATQINASVRFSTKLSSVNQFFKFRPNRIIQMILLYLWQVSTEW